jgi:hypothetical protein
LPAASAVLDAHAVGLAGDLGDAGAGHDGELALQHLREVAGDLLLDLGQDALLGFQHEHFAAEVAADLRHFHADDAAADDAQAGGRAGRFQMCRR